MEHVCLRFQTAGCYNDLNLSSWPISGKTPWISSCTVRLQVIFQGAQRRRHIYRFESCFTKWAWKRDFLGSSFGWKYVLNIPHLNQQPRRNVLNLGGTVNTSFFHTLSLHLEKEEFELFFLNKKLTVSQMEHKLKLISYLVHIVLDMLMKKSLLHWVNIV